jgi:hypothetical protein
MLQIVLVVGEYRHGCLLELVSNWRPTVISSRLPLGRGVERNNFNHSHDMVFWVWQSVIINQDQLGGFFIYSLLLS